MFKNLKIPQPTLANLSEKEKKEIVDSMEMAVYGAILGAFIQGMQVSTNDTAGDWADGDLDHNKSVESAGVALGLMIWQRLRCCRNGACRLRTAFTSGARGVSFSQVGLTSLSPSCSPYSSDKPPSVSSPT